MPLVSCIMFDFGGLRVVFVCSPCSQCRDVNFCDYPFVLDANAKTQLLQHDAILQMQVILHISHSPCLHTSRGGSGGLNKNRGGGGGNDKRGAAQLAMHAFLYIDFLFCDLCA